MKVLTWNILSSMWLYPDEDYKGIDSKHLQFKSRSKKIVSRIMYHTPDIVLLQEVAEPEYNILVSLLENTYHISRLVKHNRLHWNKYIYKNHKYKPNGNVIMVIKNIVTKSSKSIFKSVKLSDDGDYAAIAKIGKTVAVSVHLDDMSKTLHNKQIRVLLKNCTADQVIIGGDFNATPNESLHNIFKKHGYQTGTANAIATYAFNPVGIYDYIYVKGCSIDSYSIDDYMINRKNRVKNNKETIMKYGSDHYPILAQLCV